MPKRYKLLKELPAGFNLVLQPNTEVVWSENKKRYSPIPHPDIEYEAWYVENFPTFFEPIDCRWCAGLKERYFYPVHDLGRWLIKETIYKDTYTDRHRFQDGLMFRSTYKCLAFINAMKQFNEKYHDELGE